MILSKQSEDARKGHKSPAGNTQKRRQTTGMFHQQGCGRHAGRGPYFDTGRRDGKAMEGTAARNKKRQLFE